MTHVSYNIMLVYPILCTRNVSLWCIALKFLSLSSQLLMFSAFDLSCDPVRWRLSAPVVSALAERVNMATLTDVFFNNFLIVK